MENRYFTLKEIEGVGGTHDSYLKRTIAERVEALALIKNPEEVAEFIGGRVVSKINVRCDWAVEKDIFPGVKISFLFSQPDEEFGATLQALFSGERLDVMKGEDLAVLAIAVINQMLRYVRLKYPEEKLPPICLMV